MSRAIDPVNHFISDRTRNRRQFNKANEPFRDNRIDIVAPTVAVFVRKSGLITDRLTWSNEKCRH